MDKPESVLENETHKIIWYSEIQTDQQIAARWLDLVLISKKKRTGYPVDLTVTTEQRVKINKKKRQIFEPCQRTKKKSKYEDEGYTNFSWCAWNRLPKELTDIRGRIETIHTTELLGSARILRRVLETWGDLQSLRLRWKPAS